MAATFLPSRLMLLALSSMLVWAVPRGGHAQPTAERPSLRQACGADLRQHCSGVQPGGGRVLACLEQQGPRLSAACREQLPLMASCRDDASRLCGDVTASSWRSCMQARSEQLSPACRQLALR
jgi:Cysteine rich repeat